MRTKHKTVPLLNSAGASLTKGNFLRDMQGVRFPTITMQLSSTVTSLKTKDTYN